jgi:transcriptional regulator with XRE-family HTH domain
MKAEINLYSDATATYPSTVKTFVVPVGADLLRFLLTSKGLSIRDFANRLGIDSATVSQVYSGKKTSRRIVKATARVLIVPIETVQEIIDEGKQ